MAVESEVASVCVRVLQLMVGGAATSGCEWERVGRYDDNGEGGCGEDNTIDTTQHRQRDTDSAVRERHRTKAAAEAQIRQCCARERERARVR